MNVATAVWYVLSFDFTKIILITCYQVCLTHGADWAPNKLSSMNLVNRFFAKLAAVMSQNMVGTSFFLQTFFILPIDR